MQDMQFEDPNEFKDTIESWSGNVSKLEAKARRIESIEVRVYIFPKEMIILTCCY